MSAQDASMTERRREAQHDVLLQLQELESRVPYEHLSLSDEVLASLAIRKLPPLDADETAPFDAEPLFFRPYPVKDGEDFPATVLQKFKDCHKPLEWQRMCRDDDCAGGGDHCAGYHAMWFHSSLGGLTDGISMDTEWDRPTCDMCDADIDQCHLDPKMGWGFSPLRHADGSEEKKHRAWTDSVYRVAGGSKPHTTMVVIDSSRGDAETLQSEIRAVIRLLMHRYRHNEFIHHHTIPVMLYSFYHVSFARLTQAYWEGGSLVLRQSRLFDLRSDEPTADAYLFLRWMANIDPPPKNHSTNRSSISMHLSYEAYRELDQRQKWNAGSHFPWTRLRAEMDDNLRTGERNKADTRKRPGIINTSDGKRRSLLVSQNREEIYIIIAEWDRYYEYYAIEGRMPKPKQNVPPALPPAEQAPPPTTTTPSTPTKSKSKILDKIKKLGIEKKKDPREEDKTSSDAMPPPPASHVQQGSTSGPSTNLVAWF